MVTFVAKLFECKSGGILYKLCRSVVVCSASFRELQIINAELLFPLVDDQNQGATVPKIRSYSFRTETRRNLFIKRLIHNNIFLNHDIKNLRCINLFFM